ncbi:MAG: AAA family ATPase [Verrucomicrobia bacterium]|nr:AAA family ATPase [Verrucomicrobiota bacterium]
MIRSIQIKNFKAIADSGRIELTPLTVFVGHNGTGKSSVLEALEFFHRYIRWGVDEALEPWYDLDHILWQGHDREKPKRGDEFYPHPLEILLTGRRKRNWRADVRIGRLAEDTESHKARMVATKFEAFLMDRTGLWKRKFGEPAIRRLAGQKEDETLSLVSGQSVLADAPLGLDRWMFLNLDPMAIGRPRIRRAGANNATLSRTGATLSAFLLSFLEKDPDGFDAMIDSLRHILPYVADLRAETVRDMVESRSLLRMTEDIGAKHAHLPGWVLSGGTLRLLAVLAALRHPDAPEVLCIEEVENGLDPRSIGFLVEEIRYAIQEEGRQIIATTHSPYLLDKLSLSHIVTVEREGGGPPVFRRPTESEHLKQWAERFAPGTLYTMGLYRKREGGEK